MSKQGFVVTAAGRSLFAKLVATLQPVHFTRVMCGTGKLADDADMFGLTDLVSPIVEGTSTLPIYDNDTVSMILQFRSDLNGGLTDTIWLNEYGVFAEDPDGGEVLVCYGNLGDCPDSLLAYKNGCCSVRDYPITIVIGSISDVTVNYPATAFVTTEVVGLIVAEYLNNRPKFFIQNEEPDVCDCLWIRPLNVSIADPGTVMLELSDDLNSSNYYAEIDGNLKAIENMVDSDSELTDGNYRLEIT